MWLCLGSVNWFWLCLNLPWLPLRSMVSGVFPLRVFENARKLSGVTPNHAWLESNTTWVNKGRRWLSVHHHEYRRSISFFNFCSVTKSSLCFTVQTTRQINDVFSDIWNAAYSTKKDRKPIKRKHSSADSFCLLYSTCYMDTWEMYLWDLEYINLLIFILVFIKWVNVIYYCNVMF